MVNNILIEKIVKKCLMEGYDPNIYYHGSPTGYMDGKNGIHIGTKKSATQALESRIGVPSQGEWDGTRQYGETLLAGKNRLQQLEKERGYYLTTGYNVGKDLPQEDYYPDQRGYQATFSDGTKVPMNARPNIFKVRITGEMTNSIYRPHTDTRANSMMVRNLKLGNAKKGYYYTNDAEDEGSISAVVPNKTFLQEV